MGTGEVSAPYSLTLDNSDILGKITTNTVFQIVKCHSFFCWGRVSLKQVSDPNPTAVCLYSYILVFCKRKGRREACIYMCLPAHTVKSVSTVAVLEVIC